jgi:hypothetical protein
MSPFKAMFGCVEKLGMSTKSPKEIFDSIRYEEDLLENWRKINAFEYSRTLLVLQNYYATSDEVTPNPVQQLPMPVPVPEPQPEPQQQQSQQHESSNDESYVHESSDDESRASSRVSAISAARNVALKNTQRKADKMLTRSRHKCPPPVNGNTFQLPIPEVDQGPLDPNHILCCVVEIEKEKCLYKLGNKHGLIDTMFPVNGFGVCKQILIKIEEVNLLKTLSVREMARLCSNGTGQGYIKCSCQGSCAKNCK